jgi:hypothetical protein
MGRNPVQEPLPRTEVVLECIGLNSPEPPYATSPPRDERPPAAHLPVLLDAPGPDR